MTRDTFLHEWKGRMVRLGDWLLDDKPTKLFNLTTKEEIKFKNMNDAYENAVIEGESLKDIVERSSFEDLFAFVLDDSSIRILTPEEMENAVWDE